LSRRSVTSLLVSRASAMSCWSSSKRRFISVRRSLISLCTSARSSSRSSLVARPANSCLMVATKSCLRSASSSSSITAFFPYTNSKQKHEQEFQTDRHGKRARPQSLLTHWLTPIPPCTSSTTTSCGILTSRPCCQDRRTSQCWSSCPSSSLTNSTDSN